ncbi:Translation factor guf1 mitochondrial [Apiospora phragmitis]|uniref:Translation factor guf1 mitochondrial n=1 Tax=Apiospora phragmitis TaxID=2905665 RepID=A0ABR1SRA8_9PEZI
MVYPHLVETLGHVDVRAEVTASSASRGGAVLLVNILPVIHEIDLGVADVLCVLDRLEAISEPGSATAIGVGPKTGLNVQSLVPLVENVPALEGDHMKPLRMLLVDSWCDELRGVICLVRVFDGTVCAVGLAAAQIGHAFTTVGSENMVAPFPGLEELKLMVFATAFPTDSDDYHTAWLAWLACARRQASSVVCSSIFPDRLCQEHGASIITEPVI